MKTKKQARTDQLNQSAHNWIKHLDKYYSETRLTKSQVQYNLDRVAAALVNLKPETLTISQIKAVIDLIATAGSCGHTCGVELGKELMKEKGN
jgi:hypothetical protein